MVVICECSAYLRELSDKDAEPRPRKNSAYCKKSRHVTNVDKMLPS